MTEIKDKSTK